MRKGGREGEKEGGREGGGGGGWLRREGEDSEEEGGREGGRERQSDMSEIERLTETGTLCLPMGEGQQVRA